MSATIWSALLSTALCAAAAHAGEPAAADASTRRTARELGLDAIKHMERQEWEKARALLERAYRLVPAPTIALLRGRVLEKLGKLVEAAESYEVAMRYELGPEDSEAFRRAKSDASKALQDLSPRIPKLIIEVQQDALERRPVVKLDAATIPPAMLGLSRPTDPGKHRLELWVAGAAVDTQTVELKERDETRVVLGRGAPASAGTSPRPGALRPAAALATAPRAAVKDTAPEESSLLPTLGWLSLGIGAAGLTTGLVAGAFMMGHESELESACPSEECPREAEGELAARDRARTISMIGYGVGAVGAAATITLLVLSGGGGDATALVVGPGSAAIRGAF